MAVKNDEPTENWTGEVQMALLSYLIADADAYARARTIISADYFDDDLKPAVRTIVEYADKHHTLPHPTQIRAMSGVTVERFPEPGIQHTGWFLEQFERFCRYKALEQAVLKGVDLIERGRFGEFEGLVKEAMMITLASDLGTDYFANPMERLERMRDRSGYVSTGWKSLDVKLFGGFTRGALNIFAGGRGSGKSLVLQNLALNWAFAGLNVIYFTLELSEDLVSLRLDQMISGVKAREVFRNMSEVALAVKQKSKGAGSIIVKRMSEAGTTAHTLRAYLREYEIKTGIRPDAICVDYLDLMYPCDERVDPANLNIKDKYTSEELRALANERNLLCATASQLNRGAVETEDFNHAHIAGGITKISTADNLIGLLQTGLMREKGRYQFQFLKTRSSDAVGQRLDMKYDNDSLRITDLPPEEMDAEPKTSGELRAEVKQRIAGAKGAVPAISKPPKQIEGKAEEVRAPAPKPSSDKLQALLARTRAR
jgi:KaiC/GvpD/RAD55 family RecA-like ATPase